MSDYYIVTVSKQTAHTAEATEVRYSNTTIYSQLIADLDISKLAVFLNNPQSKENLGDHP